MNTITSFVVALIGVIGTFASILSVQDPLTRNILACLSVALILTGLLSIANSKLNLWRAFSISKVSKALGIANIHPTGQSGSRMSTSLKEARAIRIFAATGLVFIRTYKAELTEALSNNANILLMIADLSGQFIPETEIAESEHRVGQIKDELKQVVGILKECVEEAKKQSHDQTTCRISIAYFNTQNRLPMILCDQSYGWVTLALAPKRSSQSVSLELVPAKGGFLEDCLKHFNRIWSLLEKAGKVEVI